MIVVTLSSALITAAAILLTSAFLRLLYILPSINPTPPTPHVRGSLTKLLIVLGSGGHTAEMLAILRNLDAALYNHRVYIVSEGDQFSAQRARDFERTLPTRCTSNKNRRQDTAPLLGNGNYDIWTVPRARKIHQSLLTTPFSALQSLWACVQVLRRKPYPDLVMTNGPGTAVCVVLACLLLRFVGMRGTKWKMRTMYVESWARVKGLSLSGKILLRCVDRFLVQWPQLKGVGGRAEYLGILV
ncbi:MAG: UDP-N-acetylglucosamine transferase subunit [Piccolia ochrophora]|nr:MAG: UDP-N-acetylglucosamine transferase subunit [Piccolia ochrophora]